MSNEEFKFSEEVVFLEQLKKRLSKIPSKYFENGQTSMRNTAINKAQYLIDTLERIQEPISRSHVPWSDEENELFKNMTDEAIANKTGRSVRAVKYQRFILNKTSKQ